MRLPLMIFFMLSSIYGVLAAPVYEAGPYLIYDCQARHWACVIREQFDECVAQREQDTFEFKMHLSCGHFEEFPDYLSCSKRQLFMISNNYSNRFCWPQPWREKSIDL
jgi:hypothetical protein